MLPESPRRGDDDDVDVVDLFRRAAATAAAGREERSETLWLKYRNDDSLDID
jgi:predicted CoA-binding protein